MITVQVEGRALAPSSDLIAVEQDSGYEKLKFEVPEIFQDGQTAYAMFQKEDGSTNTYMLGADGIWTLTSGLTNVPTKLAVFLRIVSTSGQVWNSYTFMFRVHNNFDITFGTVADDAATLNAALVVMGQYANAAQTAQEDAEEAQEAAEAAKSAALAAQQSAEAAKTSAQGYQQSAQAAKTAAESANASAQQAKTQAESSAAAASLSATQAESSASAASQSATSAQLSSTQASTANQSAQAAKTAAESANASAQQAKTQAESSAAAASLSATQAESSASAASQSATSAQLSSTQASTANQSAQAAKTAAQAAQASAQESAQEAEKIAQGLESPDAQATTLPPGAQATAQWDSSVSPPVLKLGIPQGQSGEGIGDMLTSVYDPDGDGKVEAADHADSANNATHADSAAALDENAAVSMDQVSGLESALAGKQPTGNYLTEETDPTVPAWAKADTKPTYTADEVGARPENWMPTADQVGARPNTWTPTAQDVGARPDTWTPTADQVGASAKPVILTGTLTAEGWSGSAAPYTQTLTITGIPASQDAAVIVSIAATATVDQVKACGKSMVMATTHAQNSITVSAFGNIPSVDIPIVATVIE